MKFRARKQRDEARGPVNTWYCSQYHCRHIQDEEILMTYFIRSGGAADFARRYAEAMGDDNRWFCSQFHGREIREYELLWNYYMKYVKDRSGNDPPNGPPRLPIAC